MTQRAQSILAGTAAGPVIATTEALIPLGPKGAFLISESGITSAADCARHEAAGAHGFLVGESLMRQADVEAATRELLAR